jgi:transposase-like protein
MTVKASYKACWRCLPASRWPDGCHCPRCGHDAAYSLASRALLQCRACRHQTSVTAGTGLHRSRLPLTSWFAAAYLLTTHTPGFSALQLQRQLGHGRYDTAFVMLQQLRRAMRRPERDRLHGIVEVDETYIGGVEPDGCCGRQRDGRKAVAATGAWGRRGGSLAPLRAHSPGGAGAGGSLGQLARQLRRRRGRAR